MTTISSHAPLLVRSSGGHFRDPQGRQLLLRGVNFAANSKLPQGSPPDDASSHSLPPFGNHRQVSFVGRPVALEHADEHFARLKHWGLDFVRFLITWEAVEHAGPGCYDQDYLHYLRELMRCAAKHDICVVIDPHQDVWSRFTGGDGAPGWTLEALGFDLAKLEASAAAFYHRPQQEASLAMRWPDNYHKLACATMFTVFFAGDDLAPQTRIDGQSAQRYLQGHFLAAMAEVSRSLQGLDNVVGYDIFNEPSPGYIGLHDMHQPLGMVLSGACPSPWQSILLGAGYRQEVSVYAPLLGAVDRTLLNLEQCRAWLPERGCIWRENGVWDVVKGEPQLLRPQHFAQKPFEHYLKAFVLRYINAIRQHEARSMICIENVPGEAPLPWRLAAVPEKAMESSSNSSAVQVSRLEPSAGAKVDNPVAAQFAFDNVTPNSADNSDSDSPNPHNSDPDNPDPDNIVYAPHWYDVLTLFSKHYDDDLSIDSVARQLVSGTQDVLQSYITQLQQLKQQGFDSLQAPTLIGEIGLPFDLNEGSAYRDDDFSQHRQAWNHYLHALEANLLSFTLWNYNPDNRNRYGDLWNGEDLSIFSRDQQHLEQGLDAGGRALSSLVRPYPKRTAGLLQQLHFDPESRHFQLHFRNDPSIDAESEIFMPKRHYPHGYSLQLSAGQARRAPDEQRLYIDTRNAPADSVITLDIQPCA